METAIVVTKGLRATTFEGVQGAMRRATESHRKAALRRRARALAVVAVATGFCWVVWGAAHAPNADTAARAIKRTATYMKQPGMKYIILWNNYFNFPNLGFGPGTGREVFQRLECPVSDCFMTDDKTLMPPEEFDAVVFHMYYFSMSRLWLLNMGKIPHVRRPEQRYIFFLLESPENSGSDFLNMEYLFNWTMTYRSDSDIVAPYGIVVPREGVANPTKGWIKHPTPPITPSAAAALATTTLEKGTSQTVNGSNDRNALVAWLVSHCNTQSRREEYVARLSMHVGVHVYGDCGSHWPKSDMQGFMRMLQRKYKFYLSFENSFCRDYVTEKLFNAFDVDVIPIVYGSANYSAVAPPYSYIDTKDFSSPRHLAQYLHFLAQHPEEYQKFFMWKKFYRVFHNPKSTLCKFCAMLHERLPFKTYANIADWWSGSDTCVSPDEANVT